MHAWEQIQKTVDYIEDNISEELNIDYLAKLSMLSPYYFQRLFSRLVKKPLNEYIKLRRLAKASEFLHNKSKKIIDVALDAGFSSHEIFTRSFKKAFGITPEEYRSNPIRLDNFCKPQLLLNYTIVDENVPLIAEDIVIEIKRKYLEKSEVFIGYTIEEPYAQMPGNGETGIDNLSKLWDSFHKIKSDIPNIKAEGDEIGVTHMAKKEGYYAYFAGGEATSNEVKEGFSCWTLEEGEYIICSLEAENFEKLITDSIHKANKYLFETWLPKHNVIPCTFSIERYFAQNNDTTEMEIWIKPV